MAAPAAAVVAAVAAAVDLAYMLDCIDCSQRCCTPPSGRPSCIGRPRMMSSRLPRVGSTVGAYSADPVVHAAPPVAGVPLPPPLRPDAWPMPPVDFVPLLRPLIAAGLGDTAGSSIRFHGAAKNSSRCLVPLAQPIRRHGLAPVQRDGAFVRCAARRPMIAFADDFFP